MLLFYCSLKHVVSCMGIGSSSGWVTIILNEQHCHRYSLVIFQVSVVTSLSTDQQVPGSIPGPASGFFSNWELFHGMYGLGVSVLHCPLSRFCPVLYSEKAIVLCWPQVRGRPPVVSMFIYVVNTPTPRKVLLKEKLQDKTVVFLCRGLPWKCNGSRVEETHQGWNQ